jgi:endonuclease/exonuclease/phosphatase family metal-dependent hydrolase
MNKLPYLFLLVFTLLFTSCTNAQEPSEIVDSEYQPERVDGLELKVLSYNVHHCNPASKPGLIDVDGIAKVIIDSKADIVGLQEIDVNNERSGKHLDQAKELARLTGMEFYFSKGIDYKGGAFGTAILSKYPISQMETLYLPEETGTERRTLSIITVEFPEGKKIRFGNTHLDYTSDDNALDQAKAITSYFENEALPVVLVGDFNVEANSKTMAHLDKTYNRTCAQGCPNTFPVVKPSKAIDFILYSSGLGIQTLFHEVIQEHYASDHLPVLAKLRLKQ